MIKEMKMFHQLIFCPWFYFFIKLLQLLQAIKEQKFPPTTSTNNNYASVKPKLFVNNDGASLFLVQDVVLNGVTFCCKELIPDLLSAISQCL